MNTPLLRIVSQSAYKGTDGFLKEVPFCAIDGRRAVIEVLYSELELGELDLNWRELSDSTIKGL